MAAANAATPNAVTNPPKLREPIMSLLPFLVSRADDTNFLTSAG
jgi:hypothetical protein